MKYLQILLTPFALVLLLTISSASYSSDDAQYSHQSDILTEGEKMVFDAVVLRPVGLVTTVAGSAIYAISLPFSLLGGNEHEARENLVHNPARYTFKRPLGELEF